MRQLKVRRKIIRTRRQFLLYFLILILFILAPVLYLTLLKENKKVINPVSFLYQQKSAIEKELEKNDIPYSNISDRGSFYILDIKDNGKIYISNKKDIPKQIASLQLILSELTIEGKRFKSLDFRFDKPVINF